eukprot:5062087-Pleurochrysis_carterae.AAC.2
MALTQLRARPAAAPRRRASGDGDVEAAFHAESLGDVVAARSRGGVPFLCGVSDKAVKVPSRLPPGERLGEAGSATSDKSNGMGLQ